jgi:Fic family protein
MKKPETPPNQKVKESFDEILDKLLSIDKFSNLFKINDTEYPYWEEWKYKTKEWPIDPVLVWKAVKLSRSVGNKNFRLSHLTGFEFNYNLPSVIQKYLHEFDMELGGSLQGNAIFPSHEKDRYLVSSIMEEAIASSQIEGAVTTRKVAKLMLEQNRKPKTKSEQMILNNYNTMKWIVQNKEDTLTPDLLLTIHKKITNNTLDNPLDEGRFRTNDEVRVMDETNEVFYIPPSQHNIDILVQDFCNFVNKGSDDEFFFHPVIKGIILHFLIGYIHPFADGNGRTARAIFYWYLIKHNYWLIEYMSVSRIILKSKAQYARAYLYTEYDENDLTYFLLYNIKALKRSLDELKEYILRKTNEKKETIKLLKSGFDFNDRQLVIIKEIIKDQDLYFSVKQIEEKFNVSNQTARNDLAGLVNKGVLEERKSGNKSLFVAVDEFEKKLKKTSTDTIK